MSISSLAKFGNVLGSVSQRSASSAASQSASAPPSPRDVILQLIRDGMDRKDGMLPVTDLPQETKLSAEQILDAVGRLRVDGLVEIIEVPEADNRKFIRLTPSGYASFSL